MTIEAEFAAFCEARGCPEVGDGAVNSVHHFTNWRSHPDTPGPPLTPDQFGALIDHADPYDHTAPGNGGTCTLRRG